MGPASSRLSKVGVELTDSPYVVANMRTMTRMGNVALEHLGSATEFCKGLHSIGELNPEKRFICHFPKTREIWSLRLGLRRQRAARQEVLRAAHRVGHGDAIEELARGAHADPRG
jgi:hypothetical protein